jgi:hypothetical protein
MSIPSFTSSSLVVRIVEKEAVAVHVLVNFFFFRTQWLFKLLETMGTGCIDLSVLLSDIREPLYLGVPGPGDGGVVPGALNDELK